MYIVRVQNSFCAAHTVQIAGVKERFHGHNWQVELAVACPDLNEDGVSIDFVALHNALHTLLDNELDHQNLAHVDGLGGESTSSENICAWIAKRMTPIVIELREDAYIDSVTIWETPEFGITYHPEHAKK